MPEETTPNQPVEPTEVTEDTQKILALAKLKEAEAALATAKTPLVDKIIIRGILPIALAVVGPWAALTFSEQGADLNKLQVLYEKAEEEAEARKKRSEAWRERMTKIEQERAAELQAMTNMVNKLDSTLKTSMIQLAVLQILAKSEEPGALPSRDAVGRDVAAQVTLPGIPEAEVQRLAEESYDRALEAKKRR